MAIVLFLSIGQIHAKPMDVKSSINTVLKSYLDIKNALAADNSKAANEAAKNPIAGARL